MASLYKRANDRQQRVLRIVEGAVKNAADHHPEFDYSPHLARSIAKRAAGTLTADPWFREQIKLADRIQFLCHVDPVTGCWVINSSDRYGRIKINGKKYLLHRIAYEVFCDEIGEGEIIRHACDNPYCCNPRHLTVGTHKENAKDRTERLRYRFNPLRGELHPRAKLTEHEVLSVLSMHESHNETARQFGVSTSLIQQIRAGSCWRHLQPQAEVLAIHSSGSSDRRSQTPGSSDGHSASHPATVPNAGNGDTLGSPPSKRGGAQVDKPHLVLRKIIKEISVKVGKCKRDGDNDAEGLIEALRIIDRHTKG